MWPPLPDSQKENDSEDDSDSLADEGEEEEEAPQGQPASKKQKKVEDAEDAGNKEDNYDYEDPFIDDSEMVQIFEADKTKPKIRGFFINKVVHGSAPRVPPWLFVLAATELSAFVLKGGHREEHGGRKQYGPFPPARHSGPKISPEEEAFVGPRRLASVPSV